MKTSIERRLYSGKIEIREEDGKPKVIRGYAAVFNSRSENLGGFVEIIQRGAFRDVLAKSPDVRALVNHDSNLILGRTKSSTLRIGEDEIGLWYEVTPGETQASRDVMESLRRGDLDNSSFAFAVSKEGQKWEDVIEGGKPLVVRTITAVSRLVDVSIVAFPAYPDASVALRSLGEYRLDQSPPEDPARSSAMRAREIDLLAAE